MNKAALILTGIGVAIVLAKTAEKLPRGIRNKNPGNIRHGDNWQGMSASQTDSDFVQFTEPKWGIRAMAKILQSYERRGVVYLIDIVRTWAPPEDNNDTAAYLHHVERQTGIFGNEVVSREDYPKVIAALIKHENGVQPYSMAEIEEGVRLA